MSSITPALTDAQQALLDDLVHDAASQAASDAINHGDHGDLLRSMGYGDDAIDALLGEADPDEAVHDAASQDASNAINSGQQWDFLLAQGWSDNGIREALGLPVR